MSYPKHSRPLSKVLSAALLASVLVVSLLQTGCSGCRDFGKLACEPHGKPLFPVGGR